MAGEDRALDGERRGGGCCARGEICGGRSSKKCVGFLQRRRVDEMCSNRVIHDNRLGERKRNKEDQ
jgi:hypothetical protein